MRKSLLLVVFFAFVNSSAYAQSEGKDLFDIPDSVCVNQPIRPVSNVPDKQSHYWGFCSGYLYNTPTGENLGANFNLDGPSGIEVAKNDQDGNFYGFVINGVNNTFVRLNYGNSLDNVPTITDFGTMDNIFPGNALSMYLVRDPEDNNWYIFVTAGNDVATSSLSRIDFGKSLANTPNIVNFGNLDNQLSSPRGVFVAKEKGLWHGFLVNGGDNKLLRFDMGANISITPSVTEVFPSAPLLSAPTDIGVLMENNKWYFFITNAGNGSVALVEMETLDNILPKISPVTGTFPDLTFPTNITLIRDCDNIHAYVSDGGTHDLIKINMPEVKGPYTGVDYSNIGGLLGPMGMSKVIRDRDNVYIYLVNQADNTISKVKFGACTRSNIQYSLTNKPPEYRYDTAGLYNVYYAVNEGMPDMQVKCKQVRVLPIPSIFLFPTDTTICQGDTLFIRVVSVNAISTTWTPNYNISAPDKLETKVWPDFTTQYRIRMPYPLGTCVVDTLVNVTVKKIKADAGPDRTIADGASTMLGGPTTVKGLNYNRIWLPDQYIDNQYAEFPVVNPPHDFTYFLTVSDTLNPFKVCISRDTVVIRVGCEELNLPNAFMPESDGVRARFGLINRQIAKLERFNIYDRWGKKVFETIDPTKQWDGMINGEKAAVGIYVWEVDGFCLSGKRLNKTGNVMLIR